MELFELPFYQRVNPERRISRNYFIATVFFGLLALLSLFPIRQEEPVLGWVLGIFMVGLSVLCGYIFVFCKVLKKGYIEITEEYLRAAIPFRTFTAKWQDIHEASVFTFNNQLMLGIVLKSTLYKSKKRSISNMLDSMFGVPVGSSPSINVLLSMYKDIDVAKLLVTIQNKIDSYASEADVDLSETFNEGIVGENNIVKAILSSFGISIVLGLIYGFVSVLLKRNAAIIPVFAPYLIIAFFNKYYIEEYFNIGIRLLVGIICLVQVPLGVVVVLSSSLIDSNLSFVSILRVLKSYISYLVSNPLGQIVPIVLMVICFAIGAVRGRTRR